MSKVAEVSKTTIAAPNGRGGSSTEVVMRASNAWRRHDGDENLIYLVERVQNYVEVIESRLETLRGAIERSDTASVTSLAQALTDAAARMGAVRMMRHAIALQMLGRRELIDQATAVQKQLEHEFSCFKGTLISYER